MDPSQPIRSPHLLSRLTARDVMTAQPVTVTFETKLSKVTELMDEKHVQHFPVVEGERLVGLLSEGDLHDAMPSVLTVEDPEARRRYLRVTQVGQVVAKDPPAVRADAPLAEVIRTMRARRIGGIAVTEGTRVVGILTSGDLITLLERIMRSSAAWA
jgi:acetoin utilization protein AcuB